MDEVRARVRVTSFIIITHGEPDMRIFSLNALDLISVNCSYSADCLQSTAHLSNSVNTKCGHTACTEIEKL